MSGKPLVLGVCALLVSLGAAGQVNTKVKPSQHTPFPTSKSSTTGLIFNRVLKSTSISWGEPMVFEAAGNADIDPGLDFTCVGPTTCTLSAEIKVQVTGVGTQQGNEVALCGLVDGQFMEEPGSCPFLGVALGVGNYQAFAWTANMSKVAPGKHTLQSQIYSDLGLELLEYNITYRLYKP